MDPLHKKFQNIDDVVTGLFQNHWYGGCLSPIMKAVFYQLARDEQREC